MAGDPRFQTTRWSMVVAAAASEGSRDSDDALDQLCRAYWYPVFAFIRRSGRSNDDALDLTQGYFAELLRKDLLSAADRERGRFRSFLLATVKQFLSDERKHAAAQKRGGGLDHVSIDDVAREDRERAIPSEDPSPEHAFERDWATTIFRRALGRLEATFAEGERRDELRLLLPHLTGGDRARPYASVADELGVSEQSIKSGVRRLRQRFGTLLRDEVAQTMHEGEDVDAELRHLLASLG